MAKSDFERRADQLRGQIDTLRSNLDDMLSNYNRLLGMAGDTVTEAQGSMSSLAQQARGAVGSVGDTMPDVGFAWWIPVAVIGAIAAGMWIVNTFFPGAADQARDQIESFGSGMPSPFGGNQSSFSSTQPPYGEQR